MRSTSIHVTTLSVKSEVVVIAESESLSSPDEIDESEYVDPRESLRPCVLLQC